MATYHVRICASVVSATFGNIIGNFLRRSLVRVILMLTRSRELKIGLSGFHGEIRGTTTSKGNTASNGVVFERFNANRVQDKVS